MKRTALAGIVVCVLLLAGCTGQTNETPPKDLELKINDSDDITNQRAVDLTISGSDIYQVKFSNDGTNWSSWMRYRDEPSIEWNLTYGDGLKTVHFKARDKDRSLAKAVTDTIVLDTARPTILRSTPTDGQGDVPISPSINFTFSEPMTGSDMDIDPKVVGNWVWTSSTTVEFQVQSVLVPGSYYNITLGDGNKDLAGNGLQTKVIPFSTRAPASVTAHSPDGDDVGVESKVSVTFDREMDHTRTEQAFIIRPYSEYKSPVSNFICEFEWSGNTMTVDLKNESSNDFMKFETQYYVTIKSGPDGAMDAEGGILLQNYSWTFETIPPMVFIRAWSIHHNDTSDYTYIYGEIQNNGEYNLYDIQLRAVFYKSTIEILYEDIIMAHPGNSAYIVLPGQLSPFSHRVGDKDGDVKTMKLYFHDARVTLDEPYSDMEITVTNVTNDNSTYSIRGQVKNTGNKDQQRVFVVATLYGTGTEVFGVCSAGTTPISIGLGQVVDFFVTIRYDEAPVAKIDTYSLMVYAEE